MSDFLSSLPGVDAARRRLGAELFARVAGPHGAEMRRRIHGTAGPRWFGPERPIRAVHGDAAMYIGGLRALLLQSLHPLAMAAVAAHSGYRGDPWGRLQRTSTFLAVTTFGTAESAERAVEVVREVHRGVRGTSEDGSPYRASDPHLLAWVHAAETDSFLRAHRLYGAARLADHGPDGYDGYVADAARIASALGVPHPPRDRRELDACLDAYRPELHATAQSRDAARFLLLGPPLPLPVRPVYGILVAAAVSTLPDWARRELRLPPRLPVLEPPLARLTGRALTAGIRWVSGPPPATADP